MLILILEHSCPFYKPFEVFGVPFDHQLAPLPPRVVSRRERVLMEAQDGSTSPFILASGVVPSCQIDVSFM